MEVDCVGFNLVDEVRIRRVWLIYDLCSNVFANYSRSLAMQTVYTDLLMKKLGWLLILGKVCD